MFYSYLVIITGVSIIMALTNDLTQILFNLRFGQDHVSYTMGYLGENSMLSFMNGYVWAVGAYMIVGMLGFLSAIAYYRMGMKRMIIVLIGGAGLMILSGISVSYSRVSITFFQKLVRLIHYLVEIISGFSTYAIVLVGLIILGSISYSLLRRAIIKTS